MPDLPTDDDNPDATRVVRPRPSQRRPPPAAPPDAAPLSGTPVAAAPAAAHRAAEATLSAAPGTLDSLLPFAMPLLQLLAQLRTLRQADPATLRDRTAAALQSFESRALGAGHPADQVRRAHYALCDSLDDAVLNTPWGADSAWRTGGMVASFHPAIGPGRFFDALRQVQAKADTMRPVLELMVLCLSLGMLGPFRDRPAEAEALRAAAAAALLAQSPPAPGGLSETWQGVDAPYRARRRPRLPVWVAASLVLAAAGGAFLLLSLRANDSGDAMFARMLAAPPSQMPKLTREAAPPPPAPPAPVEPTVLERLRTRLAGLETGGSLVVAGTQAVPVLRLSEQALFPAGNATLGTGAAPLLQAVAEAIRPEGGQVHVLGYADDRPVRTVLFPSSFKLTAARAEAVRAALSRSLALPMTAEGRAGADPVAPNATPEGRAQNRRVELVLEGSAP